MKNIKTFKIFVILLLFLFVMIIMGCYSTRETVGVKSKLASSQLFGGFAIGHGRACSIDCAEMQAPSLLDKKLLNENFLDEELLLNEKPLNKKPLDEKPLLNEKLLDGKPLDEKPLPNEKFFTCANFNLEQNSQKKIEVRGDATVYVKPDIAILNLGILQKSADATESQTLVAQILNNIIQILRDEEIDDNDIQTSYYTVYPEYSYEKYKNVLSCYSVSCSLKVKVRDIEKAGKLLQRAIQSGANSNSGISYELSDNKKYYNEALTLAISDAEVKARNIAACLKIEKPSLIKIEERQNGYSTSMIRNLSFADSETSTFIMSGKIEVSASVEITYSF